MLCQRRKESNLPRSFNLGNPVESFPWWYHGLAQGWRTVGRYSTISPKVGGKCVLSQSVGVGYFPIRQVFILCCLNVHEKCVLAFFNE